MARRKVEELFNNHIGVETSEAPDPKATAELHGTTVEGLAVMSEIEPVMQPLWTMVFTDRDTGDQIRVAMTRKGRDGLIRELTGGIVLAGGELPSL